ncbi:MAG: NUDIX hydrolase [Pararhodobacter sp.]
MKESPLKALGRLVNPVFRRPEFIQAAALCLREGKAGREVLMVTSLSSKRWILPKGWPMKGRTLAGAALQEAWEEAGVVGTVDDVPVGFYIYEKHRRGGFTLSCRVEVFRIQVSALMREWPERHKRQRKWMPVEQAARLVDEPELKALLTCL